MSALDSAVSPVVTAPHRAPARPPRQARVLPTAILVLGALYCLVPVAWVLVASSKSPGELFSTFTFAPGTGLLDNLRALFAYGDGQFLLWSLNSLVYAGIGSVLSTLVSTMAGYASRSTGSPAGTPSSWRSSAGSCSPASRWPSRSTCS